LDIEGEELAVLQSAPGELLSRIAQMTVEFEDCHSKEAIRSVIRKMSGLGFWVVTFSWRNYGDVLFVNQKLEPVSLFQRAIIVVVHKYGRGLIRLSRRLVRRSK
jgi:tRNA G37 N-methylase Trm5